MKEAMGKHVNTILAHHMMDMLQVCIHHHTYASEMHANSLKFNYNFKCHMKLIKTCTFLTWATNVVNWHNIR
jgi:hypothetical protein